MRRIGILLFPDVEELDAVGPWEVLAFWTSYFPQDGWDVFAFSAESGPVRCAKGLTVVPQYSEADRPEFDVLICPGGKGTRPLLSDSALLEWMRRRAAEDVLMTSVCTGSLIYAAAGLLADRPATTHWAALDDLKVLDTTIDVRPDDRFVDDGDVITASGVSAGIDMALHLVAGSPGRIVLDKSAGASSTTRTHRSSYPMIAALTPFTWSGIRTAGYRRARSSDSNAL